MRDTELTRRDFLRTATQGGAALGLCGLGLGPALTTLPAALGRLGNVSKHPALYWTKLEGKDVQCLLCPRMCTVKPGERGLCASRENVDGRYLTMVYGKPAEVLVDPIEKDPFFHFRPATKTLALGTATCNLTCRYCQSWQFAQARPEQTDNKDLAPEQLVAQAKKYGLKSITFTFSEPVQCIEYVIDTAKLAKDDDIVVTLHTAAYICEQPLEDLCEHVAAINVDLKGWTETFYRDICGGQLAPVLKALKTIKASGTWLELTTLVIPDCNDDLKQAAQMAKWVKANLGPDVPWHFSRFYPKYKMLNKPTTPLETMKDVRDAVWKQGMHYVYINNVPGDPAESTYCPKCGAKVIQRIGFDRINNVGLKLKSSKCKFCGYKIPGYWT